VEEKTFSNDQLIWDQLDVENVFAVDYYSKENVENEKIVEK
jgi:hypothetical protein